MHADGNLSYNAMMKLNKFLVNRLIKNYLLMDIFFSQDWDYTIPESIDFENFLYMLNNI